MDRRIPPQSLEAERAVLGSLLIDPEIADTIFDQLQEQDFYREAHRKLFRVIRTLYEEREPIDQITVTEKLSQEDHLEDIGGAYEIAKLADDIPSSAHAEYYTKIVVEKAVLRRLINSSTETINASYSQSDGVERILASTERDIAFIRRRYDQSDQRYALVHIGEDMDTLIDLIDNYKALKGESTGITDLDKVISLHDSELYYLYGYGGMGKTSLGLNILKNRALHYEEPVAIFSMEMPKDKVRLILVSIMAGVQIFDRSHPLTDSDRKKIIQVLEKFETLPIYINYAPTLTVEEIRANLREQQVKRVFVDYLQLMTGSVQEDRQGQLEDISRRLRTQVANELQVSVICVSNLSKPIDGNIKKPPNWNQIKGSSNFYHDADNVICIHNMAKSGYESIGNKPIEPGQTLIRVDKKRFGDTGEIYLKFMGWRYTFGNMDFQHRETAF